MKSRLTLVFLILSFCGYAQFAVKNYSNAPIDQITTIQQIADWIQFHQTANVIPLFADIAIVDKVYLDIESTYLSKEYASGKIDNSEHIEVNDERNIIWYERNIYKINKNQLKPRYQIYITIEYSDGSYRILDLKLGKNKKINTSQYDQN